MKLRYRITHLLLLVVFLFSTGGQVFAAGRSGGQLELYPAFSEVVLSQPEQEETIEITVSNKNDFPVSLKVSPLDFKQTGTNGQIDFIGQNTRSYSYSLTSFLTFEKTDFVLEPMSSDKIRVFAKNRDDLSPGGHYAAVIVKVDPAAVKEDETAVTYALSSLILLRKVGGELYNLSLTETPWAEGLVHFELPKTINLLFQNEGNVHLTPYGRVDVYDMFGRSVAKGIINTSSQRVFPESRRYIQVDMEAQHFVLPVSVNRITIQGKDSLQKTSYAHSSLYVHVDRNLLIFLSAVVLFGAVVFISKLRKKP